MKIISLTEPELQKEVFLNTVYSMCCAEVAA